ncbi:MAG: putative zinc-binding protein [Candidatus Hydrogenedentes bacterium]|nr:putative zinc-binding protein [Candidatus Hydrogenedentota bacterium]
MSTQASCNCGDSGYNLVFACSGAADVGAISDRAARKLAAEKVAGMCCTAAIAARIPEILQKTKGAAALVVLDGCEKECARKVLEEAGFTAHAYVQLVRAGMEKGKTPASEENTAKAAAWATEALANAGSGRA